jgi:hypothetical protein
LGVKKKDGEMILIQVIPKGKTDAYKLLKDKVSHEANTWLWANKAKTKLEHVNANGYIEVDRVLTEYWLPAFTRRTNEAWMFWLRNTSVGSLLGFKLTWPPSTSNLWKINL